MIRERALQRRDAGKPAPVASLDVGAVIDFACAKCKRVTGHRVLRKVGVLPTRLECSVCAGTRAYRSPAAAAQAKLRRAAATSAIADPEEVWQRAMKAARGPAVAYSSSAHYPVGQRLSHADFGDGVVTARGSATVCTVVFRSGEKKMLMGSPERGGDEAAGA
jgi:hypothetical protein